MNSGYFEFFNGTWRVAIRGGLVRLLHTFYEMSERESREVLATLVGRFTNDLKVALVEDAVCFTVGEYATVERDGALVTRKMREIWDATDGQSFFLGEWHTHPGACNVPSQIDLLTARETCRCDNVNQFIMAISGADGMSVHLVTEKRAEILHTEGRP